MRILNLNQNWKGERFEFRYTTTHYYRVEVSYIENGMSFELKREQLPEPLEKSFTTSLFSDWLISPEDYGVFEGDRLLGFIELSMEDWNNRLRIANIWVDEDHRRKGIGKRLIAKAVQVAQKRDCRSIVLETQSCNDPAIHFYHNCGFKLVGLDVNHYTNQDIERGEVRLEFAMIVPKSPAPTENH